MTQSTNKTGFTSNTADLVEDYIGINRGLTAVIDDDDLDEDDDELDNEIDLDVEEIDVAEIDDEDIVGDVVPTDDDIDEDLDLDEDDDEEDDL